MERDFLDKLLSRYDATFRLSEVGALLEGKPLPTNANPTLLDIEQSLKPQNEPFYPFVRTGGSGNDNVE